MMATSDVTSKGVSSLIDRLKAEGVTAGKEEANRIISDAHAEAKRIVETANADAKQKVQDAHAEAERSLAAGKEALITAMRDAVLTMKSGLMDQFEADVTKLVSKLTVDPEMIKAMVLELVGRTRATAKAGQDTMAILPKDAVGLDMIIKDSDEFARGQLTDLTLGLTQAMLEEGVTLFAADDLHGGIRARIAGDDVELDLSDEAIAQLLMQHLQPRFRAVMEGVIR